MAVSLNTNGLNKVIIWLLNPEVRLSAAKRPLLYTDRIVVEGEGQPVDNETAERDEVKRHVEPY